MTNAGQGDSLNLLTAANSQLTTSLNQVKSLAETNATATTEQSQALSGLSGRLETVEADNSQTQQTLANQHTALNQIKTQTVLYIVHGI